MSCHNLSFSREEKDIAVKRTPLHLWYLKWLLKCRRKRAVLTVKCDTHLDAMENSVPVPSMVIHNIDVIQVGICPIYKLLDHIQCDSSGLLNFIIH